MDILAVHQKHELQPILQANLHEVGTPHQAIFQQKSRTFHERAF